MAYIHSHMNLHGCAKFGANRPSLLVAFPECVLMFVRLFPAVRAASLKVLPQHPLIVTLLLSTIRILGPRLTGFLFGFTPIDVASPEAPTSQWDYLPIVWVQVSERRSISTRRWVIHTALLGPYTHCTYCLSIIHSKTR